jgi:hypothetical protein
MGRATTTKRIRREHLFNVLGVQTATISGNEPEGEEITVETAELNDAAIASILAAYVCDEEWGRLPAERALRNLRVKCRAVLEGTDTFTVQEMQRAVARLILRSLNEEE